MKTTFKRLPILLMFLGVFVIAESAHAQEDGDNTGTSGESGPSIMSAVPGQMDAIEQLYREEQPTNDVINDGDVKAPVGTEAKTDQAGTELKGISDLTQLSEFKDVAVIQKRYLPKTKRFEGFGGLSGVLNDKFFVTGGLTARLGYSFNERYGVELFGMVMSTGEKSVTKELRDSRGVRTTNFVSPSSYYGLDLKWTPVYGKMTFLNKKITPFDLYFSAGAGMTNTNQGYTEPTFHIGTGQIFAFTKSAAFRWDFSWNFYNARSGIAGAQTNASYNNLFITLGASFFFPEARYR